MASVAPAKSRVIFIDDAGSIDEIQHPSGSGTTTPEDTADRPEQPGKLARHSFAESLEHSVSVLKKMSVASAFADPTQKLKNLHLEENLTPFQRETQHFVGISGLHGILRIYKSHGWSRVFWSFILVLCGCLLIWQTVMLFQHFANRPLSTQVSLKSPDGGLLFPKVTICNFNPVRKDYIALLNATGRLTKRVFSYIMQHNDDVLTVYGNSDHENLLEEDLEFLRYVKNLSTKFDLYEFYHDAGFECKKVIKICTFGGREFDCCSLFQPVLTGLGRCHQLNLQNSKVEWMRSQTEEGVDAGLQVVLSANIEEHYDEDYSDLDPTFSDQIESGFRITVDEPRTVSYKETDGISGSPGDRIYSAISAKSYRMLDSENWGSCRREWPKSFTHAWVNTRYSREDCESRLKAWYFHNHCGCSPFVYNIDREYATCSPLQMFDCTKKYIAISESDPLDFRWPKFEECEIECDRWEYDTYNSYSRGFSKKSSKWLKKHFPEWTAPYIRNNILTVNIFFRDLTHTEYEQVQATTITEVLSNIGGNMGMFVGMSLITLVEGVMYLTKISWIAVSKKRRNYLTAKKEREDSEARENEETLRHLKELGRTQLAGTATAQAQLAQIPDAPNADTVTGKIKSWTSKKIASIRISEDAAPKEVPTVSGRFLAPPEISPTRSRFSSEPPTIGTREDYGKMSRERGISLYLDKPE